MAYDKHTWTCDEPITVERLNHIEDGIANAGGGDCGFECEETRTLLTEESVTTTAQGGVNVGQLLYSQFIDAETITVTFDGVEYECPRFSLDGSVSVYGGFDPLTGTPDYSVYPFALMSTKGRGSGENSLATETAGTHSIKIEIVETMAITTPCFDLARGYSCEEEMVTLTEESVTTVVDPEYPEDGAYGDLSYQEVINPLIANPIIVTFNGTEYECPFNNEGSYGASYNESTGQVDWSQYPFQIIPGSPSAGTSNTLATENAGTYTIKIEVAETTVTTTPCFDLARGYSCDEEMVGFVNGRVRTVTEGSNPFADTVIPYTFLAEPPQTAKITFDFVEYECPRREVSDSVWGYGASDVTFSEYPFIVEVNATYIQLMTPTAGSYSLMIEGMATVSRPTDCFKAAVQACPTESVLTSSNPIFERKQIGCTNAQAVTIQPKARAHLFCGTSETIEYPTQTCWGSIEIGTNVEGKVLAIPNKIVGNGVYLDIYNFTDNAVTLAANDIKAQVVTFPSTDPKTACAVLGQCESGRR